MNQLSRIFLLVSITALIASCKLAVIVVEGGEVASGGSGVCTANAICIVDVSDPNFSETFAAVPDDGWYFQKWNSGGRFFCSDSTDLICALSFKGHEESKAVEDMVASTEVFYIMPVFKQFPDIITVDRKEWLQPNLLTGLSWGQINAVCPEGECSGVLKGYDMTGWTWASTEDVNAMFNYYIGSTVLGPGPDEFFGTHTSVWATAFFRDGWEPNRREFACGQPPGCSLVFWRSIAGWIRTRSNSGETYLGGVWDNSNEGAVVLDGVATNLDPRNYGVAVGGWFYRTP